MSCYDYRYDHILKLETADTEQEYLQQHFFNAINPIWSVSDQGSSQNQNISAVNDILNAQEKDYDIAANNNDPKYSGENATSQHVNHIENTATEYEKLSVNVNNGSTHYTRKNTIGNRSKLQENYLEPDDVAEKSDNTSYWGKSGQDTLNRNNNFTKINVEEQDNGSSILHFGKKGTESEGYLSRQNYIQVVEGYRAVSPGDYHAIRAIYALDEEMFGYQSVLDERHGLIAKCETQHGGDVCC